MHLIKIGITHKKIHPFSKIGLKKCLSNRKFLKLHASVSFQNLNFYSWVPRKPNSNAAKNNPEFSKIEPKFFLNSLKCSRNSVNGINFYLVS